MKKFSKIRAPLPTPEELQKWREGYKHYLEANGMRADVAADTAARIAYRPDLYPSGVPQPENLSLFSPATDPNQVKEADPPKFVDHRPEKKKEPKPSRPAPAPLVSKPKEKTKPPTPRERRLVRASAEIRAERPDEDDRGFMHSIMCQVGLPRSEVDGYSFERHSGGAALLVEAGKLWDGRKFVQQPIPYGPMPRILLAWMNTYAVRFNTAEIPVGDSASEFLRMLGKQTNGGKRGAFTTFRRQVQALSACRMTLGFNAGGRAHTYEGKPIKHFEAWISGTDEQKPLWPGSVTFSEDYFATLKAHAVPLDLRAFMELKKSALAMDVYTWLAQRLYRIDGRPVVLHWASLREQFGQEYQGPEADKNFKKKFLHALQAALAVYPTAQVRRVTGGLMLLASPPPVPLRGS